MKRIDVLLILLLILVGVASAQDSPSVAVGGEDVEEIQGAIDDYVPLDDSGEVNLSKYQPFKSKAEERIEKINEYVGPITKVLWGVELSLSWVFVFSFVMWILLIELVVMPMSEILDFNIWGSLFGAMIVATLAMQSMGKGFVVWMESLMTQWWVGFVVLVVAVIIGVVYSVFMKTFGKKVKEEKEVAVKEQTDRDRQVVHADADVSGERLKG